MGKVTSLTSKGQVTIPKAIRDELGLKPYDKIAFTIENGHARLHKAYPSLEEVAGSLPACDAPMHEWPRIIQDVRARAFAEKFR